MRTRLFSAILTLGVAAMAAACVANQGETKSDPDNSLLDYTISAFPVGNCIYTDGNRQYVAYYDTTHQMKVAQRTLPDGPWKYRVLDEKIQWDSHNFITMIKDGRGVLHLSGNMHCNPLVYLCTDESGDISTFYRVKQIVARDEDRVTYPHFLRYGEKGLIFHYRIGGSGNGNEIYDVMDDNGKWSRLLDTPLTDGRGLMNAYMHEPKLGPDGLYHLLWVWRDTPDCATNHDLSYAVSPDLKHWKNAAGEDVEVPLSSLDNSIIVDDAQPGGGMINGGQNLGFDKQGRPVIAYHKYDENGNTQLYITRFSDGAWEYSKLTDWNYRWGFKGNGSIAFELSLGAPILLDNGNFTLKYNRFDPSTGKRWSKELTIDGDSLTAIEEHDPKPAYPEWITTLQSNFAPDMSVSITGDSGDGGYILRKETLPNNRDRKPERELPPASELRVIKLK